ncbi:T9SS type A sorting domain-containing protein [Hyunsoonleella ulvae]|uniref:T9SS type A sorting domain-containing protein n=1 Tax=Hyunsoonleella ulvae TaxID=2799948 RepID=UPI0019396D16|nr:T9SS type A sorting domain-containing protein [Hyunsoonleella ulvae]
MKKNTFKLNFLLILSIISVQLHAQTSPCDGSLPFEEQNGLLTIEMESGILPSGSNWKTGSEADPNLSGSTITYIYWDGPQSFNALSNAQITYNIKINTTGTYRFAWRGRIGTGTSGGEHNDAWLRIVADDFYATKQNSATSTQAVEPRPSCTSNPDRDCPEGSSTSGYFKAFMNRHPVNLPIDQRWGFVTNTNDGDSFRFIWATFNNPGNYSIIVDARSSFFFMDKMVLRRTNVSDSNAFSLTNSESSCTTLSIDENSKLAEVKLFPNPATNTLKLSNPSNISGTLIIRNVLGANIREVKLQNNKTLINISDLKSGVYTLSLKDTATINFTKRFVKL